MMRYDVQPGMTAIDAALSRSIFGRLSGIGF
jgi:hypothetical protein